MNLPSGTVIEENLPVSVDALIPRIKTITEEEFTGYLIFTCEGFTGIEEGVLLFRTGKLIGAIFNYDRIGKELTGEKALITSFNLMRAKQGVYDIIALTIQQIDLIIAFDEEIKLSREYKLKDIQKMIPREYSKKYSEEIIGKEKEKTKEELYKELGLVGIE